VPNNEIRNKDRLILQMESLYKISGNTSTDGKEPSYDILVLDEIVALINQFFSPTMDENRLVNFIIFEKLIKNTPKLIIMDALLHQAEIDLIKSIRGEDEIDIVKYKQKNPNKRECIKIKTKNRDSIINKILQLATERNKIYVPCYSKNLIQTINQVLQDNGISSMAYYSEMDDTIKREDLGDVSKSWKQYQVVLASLLVGAGVDFSELHFDITFAIIGRGSCVVEEQFQLLHRVRNLKNNQVFLWIEKEGKNEIELGIPTLKQIEEDLIEKYNRGKEMSPKLLSMPINLRKCYVERLQREYKTRRLISSEVNRMLDKCNYIVSELELKDNSDYSFPKGEIISHKEIEPVSEQDKKGLKRREYQHEITEYDKVRKLKSKFDNAIKNGDDTLWNIYVKKEQTRQFFY